MIAEGDFRAAAVWCSSCVIRFGLDATYCCYNQAPVQLIPVIAAVGPAASYDDDVDDAAITDACFAAAFAFEERIARALEAIARRLPAPV